MTESTEPEELPEEEAAPWDLLANALGTLSELEDDEAPLDVSESFDSPEGGAEDPFHKVPLEQASNLIRLRRAVAAVKSGQMTVDKFTATVKSFIQPLEDGIHLMQSAPVQKQIAELPEDQLPIFTHLSENLKQLLGGLKTLANYKQSEDPADLDNGMSIIEDAMVGLDQTQDQAIEKGREEALREQTENL